MRFSPQHLGATAGREPPFSIIRVLNKGLHANVPISLGRGPHEPLGPAVAAALQLPYRGTSISLMFSHNAPISLERGDRGSEFRSGKTEHGQRPKPVKRRWKINPRTLAY